MSKIYIYIYENKYALDNVELPELIKEHCDLYKVDSTKMISSTNYYKLGEKMKELFNEDIDSLRFSESGKPYMNNIHVSMTHNKKYFGFAISKDNIGLDIEQIITNERLSTKILSDLELEEFSNSKDKCLYLTLKWTAKEAYAKYLGTGLVADILRTDIKDFKSFNIDDSILAIYSDDLSDIEIYVNEVRWNHA